LTDPGYSARLSRLVAAGMVDLRSIARIRVGRLFELSPGVFLSVGKDEETNKRIEAFADAESMTFVPAHGVGPSAVSFGSLSDADVRKAASVVAFYIRKDDARRVSVVCNGSRKEICVPPMSEAEQSQMMVV
jgi:hypothetical protein